MNANNFPDPIMGDHPDELEEDEQNDSTFYNPIRIVLIAIIHIGTAWVVHETWNWMTIGYGLHPAIAVAAIYICGLSWKIPKVESLSSGKEE